MMSKQWATDLQRSLLDVQKQGVEIQAKVAAFQK